MNAKNSNNYYIVDKWILITVFLALSMQVQVLAQGDETDEKTKMLLYTSVETDGHYASDLSWERRDFIRENHYKYMKIVNTPVFSLKLPNELGFDIQNYQIQLFKLPDDNSYNQARFLLCYKDMASNACLRVGGYVENDINLLFDYFLKNRKKTKVLESLISKWESLDRLFEELDLDCLLKGYDNQSTKLDCFKSVFYINVNESTIGANPLSKQELNSCFSRIPLNGFLGR
ncbi:MAG: hypothetical protein CMC96_07975 [Flavobacteriales bacterium]|nr:hypothetical protein [Flavobacteriales bacterium]|tara:strand:+ start:37675 stop:38367 length:693 start_codon:yes stop_codon:yes gene_type:complete